jgi:dihydrofolate reductase/thymidylate synthase
MKLFNIITAVDNKNGIGKNNSIPWHKKDTMLSHIDLQFFKNKTSGHTVIMGRKTYESMNKRLLPNRINIIISTTLQDPQLNIAKSFEEALELAHSLDQVRSVWVIGGSKVYKEALAHPLFHTLFLTHFPQNYDCDTFFPPYNLLQHQKIELYENFYVYEYKQINQGEYQYKCLLHKLLTIPTIRNDRTNTGVLSDFGYNMSFDLTKGRFPLLTTKRVFFRGVAEELLWFIKGSTDAKELQKKNVHIWDGNGSREFLDGLGFTDREEGDLGPVYGFQWRHFGAEYKDCKSDYTMKGFDQLQNCIHLIKTEPTSRRIIMSAWNPSDMGKMALPPCHILCQFYVDGENLSCQMYQRSADVGLGVPFNIASYSLLTCMVAHVCNLKPKTFHYCMGDTHIYKNHVEALKTQLLRTPRNFPVLKINKKRLNIDDFQYEDFELIEYNPYPNIKMDMAV